VIQHGYAVDAREYTLCVDQESALDASNHCQVWQIQLLELFRNNIQLAENLAEKVQKPSGFIVRNSLGKPKMVERGSESSRGFSFQIANTSAILRGILLQKKLTALKNLYWKMRSFIGRPGKKLTY
jgi:hypothetical protein